MLQFLAHLIRLLTSAIRSVGRAIGEAIAGERYTCWAAAVMPDHVHLLIRKHRQTAEDITENLMTRTRQRLRDVGHVPPNHPAWAGGCGWHVFLEHPDDVQRTIKYIRDNAAQPWPSCNPATIDPCIRATAPTPPTPDHSKPPGATRSAVRRSARGGCGRR